MPAFLSPLPLSRWRTRRSTRARARAPLRALGGAPPPRRGRGARLPRARTAAARGWPWRRRAPGDPLRRALDVLLASPLVEALSVLGGRFLRQFAGVCREAERRMYPVQGRGGEVVEELVVEYGIAAGSEADKWYVDELAEWDLCSVTWYLDSFGRRVYPGVIVARSGGSGVFVGDFRDVEDDEEDGGEAGGKGADER